jgi:hypothetical protein
MKPADVIAAVAKPHADVGSSFYFVPETIERGKAIGLDGFRFYFLGRGGVLGDVESGVVQSAFGYFNPSLLDRMWTSARKIVPPRDAGRLYLACAHEHGRRRFGEIEGLDAYVDAAARVISAADGGAMALFAGMRAEPVPDDAPAAAIHQAVVMREMRGSIHLAAISAVGLSTKVAHAISRPNDVDLFGWKDDPPVVTDDARALHARAEQMTGEALVPAFSTLSGAQAHALVAGAAAMHGAQFGPV